jgi:hypothetical protein
MQHDVCNVCICLPVRNEPALLLRLELSSFHDKFLYPSIQCLHQCLASCRNLHVSGADVVAAEMLPPDADLIVKTSAVDCLGARVFDHASHDVRLFAAVVHDEYLTAGKTRARGGDGWGFCSGLCLHYCAHAGRTAWKN